MTASRPWTAPTIPDYDDLPINSDGTHSGWGVFGEFDSVGRMNLLDSRAVVAAAGLVNTGEVFPLDVPLDFFEPPLFDRPRVEITPRALKAAVPGFDDVYNNFNPQSSSQWDALAHAAYAPDAFYNNATEADVLERKRDGIQHWAERGIVGRGVLLDLKRTADARNEPYSPGTAHSFTVDDLEEARQAAGIDYQPGDVIMLHTGYTSWYSALSLEERTEMAPRLKVQACGVEHTEAMARYLWNTRASAIVSDCPAVEVYPMDYTAESAPFGFLHRILIGQFGFALGELWKLDDLAQSCEDDGRHAFMVTSAPLHAVGGIGSSANALAIK